MNRPQNDAVIDAYTCKELYHGIEVADPYRWLESETRETQLWSEAQQLLTRGYLAHLPPEMELLKERVRALWSISRYSTPLKQGDCYYYLKNSGLQNQPVLYMSTAFSEDESVVLDPNTWSAEGTVALTQLSFSRDGQLLAYSTSTDGSSWQVIKIRDLARQKDYDEEIKWCRFQNIAWRRGKQGFYYSGYPEPGTVPAEAQMRLNKIYWHEVGTGQEQDQVIFEEASSEWLSFSPGVTYDDRYLLLTVRAGTDSRNRIYYREIESEAGFTRLVDEADASYRFIGNSGPVFYFHTTLNAPRGRIIAIDTRCPERACWREIVAEQADSIYIAFIAHQQFVVVTMHDAHHRIRLYALDGTAAGEIALPLPGSLIGISGKPDETEMFLCFTSFLQPPALYRYDSLSATLTQLHRPEIDFDVTAYETRQVHYLSKDGTLIPMFLTHKKGLVCDGTNPVLLAGYGGFGTSMTPFFTAGMLAWMELGGVYAVANIRGGGEYGEAWHQAGMLGNKQNVFDDFIAAAEWLIASKYTSPAHLAISGESNGGLLVAACLVQRPDLYAAVICTNPVIDMLRYQQFTVGKYWVQEYGDAENNPEHFAFLFAYSPLHNVKSGTAYPATLIMTSSGDDRVVPAHARKFAAVLQAAQSGPHPILLHLQTKTGHGPGKVVTKEIEEQSAMLVFLCKTLRTAS